MRITPLPHHPLTPGTRVAKINAAFGGDAYPDGARGTVLAAIGPPLRPYGYIVRFDVNAARMETIIGYRAFVAAGSLSALSADADAAGARRDLAAAMA